MAITNGYCTLNEAKQWINRKIIYTAATISFTNSSSTIGDTAYGLGHFVAGDIITVSGSTSNDGTYTIATASAANALITSESLTDEAASASITITQVVSKSGATNPADDARIEDVVEAASRRIDNYCMRTFFGNTETRKYRVGVDTEGLTLWLDKPLLSVTSITNADGSTIASGQYVLLPLNATAKDRIRLTAIDGQVWQYTSDPDEDQISIAGSWGSTSTAPADIKQACMMETARLWRRKDAVFGVAGTTVLGEVRMGVPNDPDIMALLAPHRIAIGYDY